MPSPVRIYAGTQEGLFVWRSKNCSWNRVAVSFETGTIDSIDGIRSRPNVVYLGIEPIHLYRSEDGGESWEELTGVQDLPSQVKAKWSYPRPPHREHVRHIFVDPDDPKILHVCLEHGGIIRSFDRGKTWQDVSG